MAAFGIEPRMEIIGHQHGIEHDDGVRQQIGIHPFANIHRLADEGKLVVAGPFGDKNDWRGMFIFNVETVEDAQKLTATDPVIKSGLMVADYHKLYCSAALMEIGNIHKKIAKENF